MIRQYIDNDKNISNIEKIQYNPHCIENKFRTEADAEIFDNYDLSN